MRLSVEVHRTTELRFDDGAPVRAASGIAPFGDGWLVVQDDATAAAWWRGDGVTELRLFPPVEGHDRFSEEAGTKRLKPDLEAACAVIVDGHPAALLLGSGSLAARTRAALVSDRGGGAPQVRTADLRALYDRVGAALGIPVERRNLEGACLVGDRLRWFQRGDVRAGIADASVDVPLAPLLAAVRGDLAGTDVPLGAVRRYDLTTLGGEVPLAITDAVTLTDGSVLVAAAAEDTDDPVADGPVSASALAIIGAGRDGRSRAADVAGALLPTGRDGAALKVEGLAIVAEQPGAVELLAVVDADDAAAPSPLLHLTLRTR